MNKVVNHFLKICKHKYYVGKYCFKFGLYRQGIMHDLSKFSPTEFITSVKYYQGNRSPIEAEKEEKGYSMAWAHHHNKNKHHWQYWLDHDNNQSPTPMKIPYNYVIEAVCDWIGANRAYLGDKSNPEEVYKHYKTRIRVSNEASESIWHFQTRQLWDTIIIDLKERGINYVVSLHKNGVYKKIYETNKAADGKYVIEDLKHYNDIVAKYFID